MHVAELNLRHDGPHISQCLCSEGQLLLHQGVDATIASLIPHKEPLVCFQRFLHMTHKQRLAMCKPIRALLKPRILQTLAPSNAIMATQTSPVLDVRTRLQ